MEWHLTAPGKVYDRGEGLVVYFHPPSGDTHLISDLAASVLAALAEGPASSEALVASQAGALDEWSSSERVQLIDDVLEELESFDLVEPH